MQRLCDHGAATLLHYVALGGTQDEGFLRWPHTTEHLIRSDSHRMCSPQILNKHDEQPGCEATGLAASTKGISLVRRSYAERRMQAQTDALCDDVHTRCKLYTGKLPISMAYINT